MLIPFTQSLFYSSFRWFLYIHSFLFIFKMHEKKFRNGIKLFNFIKWRNDGMHGLRCRMNFNLIFNFKIQFQFIGLPLAPFSCHSFAFLCSFYSLRKQTHFRKVFQTISSRDNINPLIIGNNLLKSIIIL